MNFRFRGNGVLGLGQGLCFVLPSVFSVKPIACAGFLVVSGGGEQRGIAVGWGRGYNNSMGTSSEPSRPQEESQPEPPEAIREAVEYGIDVSMLRANLALTPAERLRRHQIALNTAEMLRKAKRR